MNQKKEMKKMVTVQFDGYEMQEMVSLIEKGVKELEHCVHVLESAVHDAVH